MSITSVQIIDMFETAHEVEKKLPPAVRNGMASMRFDVVNDKTEHAAWHNTSFLVQSLRVYVFAMRAVCVALFAS